MNNTTPTKIKMEQTKESEYKTTREDCQSTIDKYGNVCDGCGGEITPIETVDNAGAPTFWAHCAKCSKFTNGVKVDIFLTAKAMVLEQDYRPYSFIDRPNAKSSEGYIEYYNSSQIAGASSLVWKVLDTHKKIEDKKIQP